MGYYTKFDGQVRFNDALSLHAEEALINYIDGRHDPKVMPSIHCDWRLVYENARTVGIEWNGCETSYSYTEWLQLLINTAAEYDGCKCNGQIRYRGERFDDVGVITVQDNVVIKKPIW